MVKNILFFIEKFITSHFSNKVVSLVNIHLRISFSFIGTLILFY